MAISINSAADARYYASRVNSSKNSSSSAAKKSTSSIVSSAARAVASATSAVKSVVKKNSSSATTTTKRNNTNAAVNAASASVKSKTNQNKKTTTTVSSAASKVASSISKAVKTATNAVKTAAQNTKVSTNAKAAAASTTKTASKNTTSRKNTTNATAAAVNNSNIKKTTSPNNNNLVSRIVNTVSTAASTVKKATSNVNTSAAERARQEAMFNAASARAEAEAKARAAALTKSNLSAKTNTSAVVNSSTNNKTTEKNIAVASMLKNTQKTMYPTNTIKVTNTTINPNAVKVASTTTSLPSPNDIYTTSIKASTTIGFQSKITEETIINLEKEYGTSYVSKEIFNGDTSLYDPVSRAAKLCGIQVNSLTQIQNSGGAGYRIFMQSYNPSYRLQEENISRFVSYNQNGNWYNDGNEACKATSLAIVASINSDTFISPLDVGANKENGYLSNPISVAKNIDGKDLEVTSILNENNITHEQQLDMIKKSLLRGEAISVQTTTNSGRQHWVVVTGTVENCSINDIQSIDDLIGIDPYYGSCTVLDNKITVNTNTFATMKLGEKNTCLGSSIGNGYITVKR